MRATIQNEMKANQFGFMHERYKECTFLLHGLSKRMIELNSKLDGCFVAYSKAFDQVQLSLLCEIVTDLGLCDTLIESILPTRRSCQTREWPAKSLSIGGGVRQGYVVTRFV